MPHCDACGSNVKGKLHWRCMQCALDLCENCYPTHHTERIQADLGWHDETHTLVEITVADQDEDGSGGFSDLVKLIKASFAPLSAMMGTPNAVPAAPMADFIAESTGEQDARDRFAEILEVDSLEGILLDEQQFLELFQGIVSCGWMHGRALEKLRMAFIENGIEEVAEEPPAAEDEHKEPMSQWV